MAAFISSQLDFIFFFYGLAFILLGGTCFAISREGGSDAPWLILGLFGFLHGFGEWLDLTALVIGDTPSFAVGRTALMTISFIALGEFARRQAVTFSGKGRRLYWLYLPLVAGVVLTGQAAGVNTANALARYTLGFGGALTAGLAFLSHAKRFSGRARHLAMFTAGAFGLYAVAAGLIVPMAPFWPADHFNYDWFIHLTDIPIQLVRGILACTIALAIWSVWGELLVQKVASPRYTAYLQRQFIWTLGTMAAILVCGWVLTDFLGGIYKQNVQVEARGDVDLLSSYLAGQTAPVEGMVRALAGGPSVSSLVERVGSEDLAKARTALSLDVDASGATLGFILDRDGKIILASDVSDAVGSEPPRNVLPDFQEGMAGISGHHFAFNPETRRVEYYASYPIRDKDGSIGGVAVLKKSLDMFEKILRQFDRPYYLIDPNGIVALTNRPTALFRPFWPLTSEQRSLATARFGTLNDKPMLKEPFEDATWTTIDGNRDYVRRRFADFSRWSLVISNPTREIFASRVLGIVITLLVTIMALIHAFGRERWIRDRVEMEKRLYLQELAQNLRQQATTDPLTGLSNRLKFNQVLANEILRAERYKTPLALALYDIDYFKRINDSYGHPAGDKVLVELSGYVSARIRSTDLLTRWGGEEFILLFPGSDAQMAYEAAEKLRSDIETFAFEQVGKITCSFGTAQYIEGETAEAFIARADKALYRAKIKGRNRVESAVHPMSFDTRLVS